MISVVIPLYNKEIYIGKTLENVFNQTFQDFEIIIVNDGSSDGSVKIVESFKDERIRLINKENGGVSSARNVGIKNASFDYVAFLDADDEWLPSHLQELVKLIDRFGSMTDVFVTNFARKYPEGQIIPNRKENDLKTGIVDDYFKYALKKAVINSSCVCVTKRALNNLGGFNEELSRGEDIDLWSKLCREYKLAYSSTITSYYLMEAVGSCSFKLPDPTSIYAYYIDLSHCGGKYDFKYSRMILIRRFLRYWFLDKNFKYGYKMWKKQKAQLVKFFL